MTPPKYQIGDRFLYHLPVFKIAYEGVVIDIQHRSIQGWCYVMAFKESHLTASEKDLNSWYKIK